MAVALDLLSRRVVGWSMKADRDAARVMDAPMMAGRRGGKADALLHRLDQGSRYTNERFQRPLLDNCITCSMGRPGDVRDSSARESFFSSRKPERTARKVCRRSTASGRPHRIGRPPLGVTVLVARSRPEHSFAHISERAPTEDPTGMSQAIFALHSLRRRQGAYVLKTRI
ncbi:DDE-type integrase/transposase/recombinase [uncultured Albimonas sp.]|uniref:DDE-type integrase/transposase/recombinase n=1 Tax=uncultured Albimonas sp. TaxID=1331701 RepID=UPI0030EC0D39